MADETNDQTTHTAGAFDIRTFIAALMGIYGVILVLTGIFGGDQTSEGTTAAGNINLVAGITMLIFAGGMQGWALWRPTIVDEEQLKKDHEEQDGKPPPH